MRTVQKIPIFFSRIVVYNQFTQFTQKSISDIQKSNRKPSEQSTFSQGKEQNTFKPIFKKSGNDGSINTTTRPIENVKPIIVPIAENTATKEENNIK